MGLFNSVKKTYVSSVIYNMAGPIEDRPEFLKSAILGNMLTQSNFSASKTIQSSLINGPGVRLRSFHRWALKNYKQVGVPSDTVLAAPVFDETVVAAELLETFGITASIDWIDSGPPDITMWGLRWLRENLPERVDSDWRVDYIDGSGELMIVFGDNEDYIVFNPVDFRARGNWIYISYSRPMKENRWTESQLFIYETGTGSEVLDKQFLSFQSGGRYLPFIPIRHENKFLSNDYMPAVYKEAKKAYKKAIGNKFDDLVDQVKDNPDLKEIDFAYVAFGVSLNTKDIASRRYLFRYFEHLYNAQLFQAELFSDWVAGVGEQQAARKDWDDWRVMQQEVEEGLPVVGEIPGRPPTMGPPSHTVRITDSGPGKTNFRMDMIWNSLEKFTGVGLAKPDAKAGDVWFTFDGTNEIDLRGYSAEEAERLSIPIVSIIWQTTATTWKKLVITGLRHQNHIYNGKYDETTAAQALVNADESGFLVPINYQVFRQMSLVDATQMSTQCCHMVFNCYQIVKKKWYQRGAFKVLVFIVVIIIVAVTGGFGAAGVGILGTNAAVGAALGFAGLAATIAGVIANMVAAMIITKLITYASVEIFGEKIGYIVAAIATFVTLSVGSSLQSGGSLASSWSAMMEPMNLLHLTNSVGNGYAQMLNSDTMEYVNKTKDAIEDFRTQTLDIQQRYADNFGYGSAFFDPMSLTEVGDNFFTESADTFLARTLMTGSDIAEMTKEMVTNFTTLTLSTEPVL